MFRVRGELTSVGEAVGEDRLAEGRSRAGRASAPQCFGFDPQGFFDTVLRMRRQVADSAFGRYLILSARDQVVRRTDVIDAFMRAFQTRQPTALQLRCERDARGDEVLTQLWITLHADALARFPHGGSLMNAPIAQDNCPARFRVPGWR